MGSPRGGADGAPDLSPLERVAAELGLGTLTARVVPASRRRERWFAWGPGELLVSERIVERLDPGDARVLLVQAVLQRRRAAALVPLAVGVGLGTGLLLLGVLALWPAAFAWAAGGAAVLGVLAGWSAWAATAVAADDETVERTGAAETLCRALNRMDQDVLTVGGRAVAARPDLHARAERLALRHQLRLPPELRDGGDRAA